jgi:hypothetical protein
MNAIPHPELTSRTRTLTAPLHYLADMDDRPSFHVHNRIHDNLKLVPQVTPIAEAREKHTSLDAEGFCLVHHRTSVSNLTSKREVLSTYGPEMCELLGALTGATVITAAPLGVVRMSEASGTPAVVHRPLRLVHADYSDRSATLALQGRLSMLAGQPLPPGRHAIYHAWRVLTPAPQDSPLALCDARTVSSQDCVPGDTILDFPGSRTGRMEVTLFRYNPSHSWYYFPDMTRDEVLVFKDFDSDPAHPCRVPHTAFDDPTCPAGTPARVSIDLQLFVMF